VSTDDNEAIGARLREIRQAKGLSAREAAERAGVTPAYLSRLETGKLSPTVASVSRVMQALGRAGGRAVRHRGRE
jgi:transcriptional regulator with XRE-family HTH domain